MGCEESIELPPNYVIINNLCSTKLYDTFKVKKVDSSKDEIMKQYNSIGRRLNDRKMFQKEIEKISNINHPYILKYSLITEFNNHLLVIMPHIKMNLIDFSHTIKYTTKMQLMVIRDIVVAIAYLHQNGFVHGNLKPSNILVCEDFSKCIITDYCQNIIYNSYRAGIPYNRDNYNYLSPESLLNKEITNKSDIWSVGRIIYFVIQRKHLLKSDANKRNMLNNIDSIFRGVTVFESMGKFLKKVFIYDPKERMNIDNLMKEIMINEFIKIPEEFEFEVMEQNESEQTYSAIQIVEREKEIKKTEEIKVNEFKMKEANNNNVNDNMKIIDNYINSLNPDKDTIIDVSNSINNNYFYNFIENLSDEDVTYLSEKISPLQFITAINVSSIYLYYCYYIGNNISNIGLSKICTVIKENKNIKSINISGNRTNLNFIVLYFYARSSNLNEIILNSMLLLLLLDAKLGDYDFIRLTKTFCDIPQLVNIEVSGNNITDYSFKMFAEEMEYLSQIESLNFSNNSITDDGFLCFIDRISCISSLRSLNINRKSIEKLIDQLSVCTNLKKLDIYDNSISNVEEIRGRIVSLLKNYRE